MNVVVFALNKERKKKKITQIQKTVIVVYKNGYILPSAVTYRCSDKYEVFKSLSLINPVCGLPAVNKFFACLLCTETLHNKARSQ